MGMYLRTKFLVSSMILTRFRQGGKFTPTPHTSKQTPKESTQIRIKPKAFDLSVSMRQAWLSNEMTTVSITSRAESKQIRQDFIDLH